MALLALSAGTQPAVAQGAPPQEAPVGFVLTPQFVLSSPLVWDAPGAGGTLESKFLSGVGLELQFAIRPYTGPLTFAPCVAIRSFSELTILGGCCRHVGTSYQAGVEGRVPLSRSLLWPLMGGVGGFSSAANVNTPPSFTFATFGTGLQLFPSRRFALSYGLEWYLAVGGARVHASAHHVLGMSWYLGS